MKSAGNHYPFGSGSCCGAHRRVRHDAGVQGLPTSAPRHQIFVFGLRTLTRSIHGPVRRMALRTSPSSTRGLSIPRGTDDLEVVVASSTQDVVEQSLRAASWRLIQSPMLFSQSSSRFRPSAGIHLTSWQTFLIRSRRAHADEPLVDEAEQQLGLASCQQCG